MDAKTLEALKQSHEKWLANAGVKEPEGAKIWVKDCPLCDLFRDTYSKCSGCPIRERTGRSGCGGTPYLEAANSQMDWIDAVKGAETKFRAAAQEMADFIGDVLEEYESGTKQENVKQV